MSDAPIPSLPPRFGDDRYEVTGPLGSGGMGLVVRAHDHQLDRPVAIKVLADNLAADDQARERFRREAHAAAALTDPHVVAVHDVGEEQGRPYLVMELVDGPSFAQLLSTRGPLDPDAVGRAARGALHGLRRAHDAGVLHRDVKPGNLLDGPDGTVKVTDFGVAAVADAPGLTRTGFVIGTAGYLAPERRRGEPATPRTDLWSLGATLVELATGHPPDADTSARLDARAHRLPVPLRRLLDRLLADEPDARPASAAEALALLSAPTDEGEATATHAAEPGTTAPPVVDAADAATRPMVDGGGQADVTGQPASTGRDGGAGPQPGVPVAAAGPEAEPRTRWMPVVGVALAMLLVVLVLQLGGEETPAGGVFEVEVDPDDPAGTARDLAERLRARADG